MFEDSLLESGNKLKTKQGTTAAISFAVQMVMVGFLVLIPLIFTEALPKTQLMTFLSAPPPPPPPPPPAAAVVKVVKIQTEMIDNQLRTPTKIPEKVQMIKEEDQPPTSMGVMGGVPGGVPGGQMGGVIGGIISSTAAVPRVATPQRVRVSGGVIAGQILQKTTPNYPPLARSARIQGNVVLAAVISKTGAVERLSVISGHPMLVPSALDAVKQWRYKPYLLNNEPVEVDTQVTVIFSLSGG